MSTSANPVPGESRHLRAQRALTRLIVPVIGTSLALVLAACSSSPTNSGSAATGGTENLSVLETTPSYANLPDLSVYYGTGAQYKLQLKNATSEGGGSANQQFAGGVGDIFVSGFSSAVRLNESGTTKVTILAATIRTNVFAMVSKYGSPYHSLNDLRGKTIGVTGPASLSLASLDYALKQANIPQSAVQVVDLGGIATELAGVIAGHVDAAFLISPVLDSALASKQVQIVQDFRTEPYPAEVILARTDSLKSNPGLYCTYLSALRAGMSQLQSDPKFAMEIATKAAGQGISVSAVKAGLTDYVNNRVNFSMTFTPALYNYAKMLETESGDLKTAGFPSYESLTAGVPTCKD